MQENRRNAAPNGADGKAGAARRSRGGKRRTEDGGRPKGDGEAMRGKPFPRPPPGVQGGKMFDPGLGHTKEGWQLPAFLVPQAGGEPARL